MSHYLRPLAWATLVATIVLVVTGGAVRLTGSGLGCPTWPRCHGRSFTPHGEMNVHAAIEFGNRSLTFVLTAVAIATLVAAWRTRHRGLALALALGIPAQAVIGGVTVLTDLNPWVVSLHLVCSLLIIALSVLLIWRLSYDVVRPAPMAWAVLLSAVSVLLAGTVVTGSGPHAGDAHSARNGLDPLQVSQAHADLVFLFLGLTVGLLFAVRHTPSRRPVVVLLGVSLAQALVGFVQYFTDLPVVLVGFHMLGAALIMAAATWVLLATPAHTDARV